MFKSEFNIPKQKVKNWR